MESIPLSFLLSVAAGVVCHYLCKWLDERVKGNRPGQQFPARNKGTRKSPQATTLGGFLHVDTGSLYRSCRI